VTDALIVFERLSGPTLAHADLDALASEDRDRLFRRIGRLLRVLEQRGMYHTDAKANNWIVLNDDKVGPTPILIDVDGIRKLPAVGAGIERLLRSMREHAQYTPADSLALCQGYAPYATNLSPSPGTPGEGRGEGSVESEISNPKLQNPHPNPLPEYREREPEQL
jgi:hypothetical protein